MRLFTGISVAEEAIPRLAQWRSTMQLEWTPAANLHITTKFIGEWPEARLPELRLALAGVPCPGNFDVTLTGIALHSHVLLAEVAPAPRLIVLADATEVALESLGCAPEARSYRPHVTLARLRRDEPARLRETIAGMDWIESHFAVAAFHLYMSRASVYTKLATFSS